MKDMSNIKHLGVVDEIERGHAKVKIVQGSACASCKVASRCGMSEQKEKIVDVFGNIPDGLNVGDSVFVVASQRMGYLAVLVSSVIPLFLLVIVLLVVIYLTGNDLLSALTSLCSLIPYYLIVYMLRDKLRVRLSFKMERSGVVVS